MEGRFRIPLLSSLLALGLATGLRAESPSSEQLLSALERTTAGTWRPSMAAVQRKISGDRCAADLPVAADLLGPVFKEALEHRFEWKVGDESARTIALVATPRDSVDRLFVGRIELDISRESGLVDSIRFLDHQTSKSGQPASDAPMSEFRLVSEVQVPDSAEQASPSDGSVEKVLEAWAKSTAAIQNVKLSFERYRYDRAFHLETRAIGKFVYVAPNHGMYRIQPAPIPVGTESRVLGADGQRFTLRTDSPQSLLWDGSTVTIADDTHRTMQQLNLPKRDVGIQRVVGSWDTVWAQLAEPQVALPCVVGVNAKELMQRFRVSILRNDDQQIVLRCLPGDAATKHQLSEILVIVDPQTHLTKATKFIGPSGDLEIVHVFLYEQMNQPELQQSWAPDLKEYRTMEVPPPAPPAE